MAIEPKDLLIYKSQVNLDTDDGGGSYSGQVLIDGQSNNLFPDVSELDRAVGSVDMRKIFPAVDTLDTDSLMGATVLISENPADPNVSALLFSTKDWTDRRSDAQDRLENYLAKGAQAVGSLLDTAYQGMKAIQVAMDKAETENSIGDTLVLVSNEGLVNEQQQYIRLTAVETRLATIRANNNNVEYKIATYSFSDALARDFAGISAVQWYSNVIPATILRETLVADSGKYYASQPLVADVSVGSFTVNVASIFAQLIPSSQTETPLIDLNASGESVALVAGNIDPITVPVTTIVGTSQSLYLGSSVLPSSMAFTLFGQAVTDNGGTLRTTSNTQVGTIDYQTGHIVWTNAIGSGNTSFDITFTPAAAPIQPFQSYAVPVTQNNQGNNWTGVLIPIPAPGALSISYMSQGKFYVLRDNGTGRLVGGNQSFGTGTINYQTGSWLLTTGALPDVGTPILLQWGSPISTFARADLPVAPAGLDFVLFHNGIVSATVTWLLDGVTKTATANSAGNFTGDATGYIRLNDGKGRIIPNKLPQANTVFTITYDYGSGKSQTLSSGAPDVNQQLSFTIGTGVAIKPGSVGLDIPVHDALSPNTVAGTVALHDVPLNETIGNLVDQFGLVQGTITYATGAVQVTPVLNKTSYITQYQPLYMAG